MCSSDLARFLALVLLIAIAYSLQTIRGQQLNSVPKRTYICRIKESHRSSERHSDFWIGTYGTLWVNAMETFSDLVFSLLLLKPQKRSFFLKGLNALRYIQQSF